MSDWDDDNFEPQLSAPAAIISNKWEGEDEEDNVKDNWEDEDEEKEKKEEEEKKIVEEKPKPKKKTLQEKIAEKERLKREEQEKRLKQLQEEDDEDEDDITPEEKLRRQKESDLHVALETTFGGSDNKHSGSIDSMYPTNKEEFEELSEALSKKLQPFVKNEEFPGFAESVIRNICATLTSNDLKKIKTTIDNLYLEKQKIEKGDKAKKKSKVKAKLRVDDNNLNQYSAYVDDYVDYDDFM